MTSTTSIVPVTHPSDSRTTTTTLPTDAELVLKVIPMPADCNANGDIFGGWVMAQVDLAGAVLPARYVQGRIATVGCGVMLSISSFNSRGTPTLATLAPTMKVSAAITRHLYSHK